MARWVMREKESGVTESFEAPDWKAARQHACDWIRGGDYDASDGTIWADVVVWNIGDPDGDVRIPVRIDPPEPRCTASEHDWESPIELVGGIKENPGIWGHGGGVIINEACVRCGCKRVTDTWAQRRDTGEQGLESVRYEERAYDVSKYNAEEES